MSDDPTFEFITQPELYGAIPEPEPGNHELPAWYTQLPMSTLEDSDEEAIKSSTVRACMPFLEAMKIGWILKTPADIHIDARDGEFDVYSELDYPVMTKFNAEQLGSMFPESGYIINFQTHWRMEAPDGWSALFTDPMNRPGEDRFHAFSGIIDVDKYAGPLNQPSIWLDEDFHGVVPQGTPISQIVPFHRDWLDMTASARPATEDEQLEKSREQNAISANPHHYKEDVWEPIDGAAVITEDDGWEES